MYKSAIRAAFAPTYKKFSTISPAHRLISYVQGNLHIMFCSLDAKEPLQCFAASLRNTKERKECVGAYYFNTVLQGTSVSLFFFFFFKVGRLENRKFLPSYEALCYYMDSIQDLVVLCTVGSCKMNSCV